jgi:hypothetical protein
MFFCASKSFTSLESYEADRNVRDGLVHQGEAKKLERKANIQSRVHPQPLLSSLGLQEQYTKKL